MAAIFLPDFKTLSPLQLTCKVLSRCGVMNQEGRPWTLIIAAYNGIMLILFGVLSAVKIYMDMEDFTEIIQPIVSCLAAIHLFVKFVYIQANETRIRTLFNQLEQLRQQELDDPLYANQITKRDNYIKTFIYRLNLYFQLFPFVSTFFNVINDYVSAAEKPSLVLPIWMPWNYQKSWPYVAALVTSTLTTLAAVVMFSASYSLLFSIIFQMSVLLKILQTKMEVHRASDISIFRQHINFLLLLKEFNEVFSGQYYLEAMISSIQPCGFCYEMIMNLRSGDSRWLDSLNKFIYSVFAPLIICACGEEINSQVEKLHESSYRNSWYEEQPAARKQLLILMTATSRPFQFNYRGLLTFNLMCFATVMQAFYSYLTMLINLQSID